MARLEILLKQLTLGALYRRGVNSSIGGRVFRSSTTLKLKTQITILLCCHLRRKGGVSSNGEACAMKGVGHEASEVIPKATVARLGPS